MLQGRVERYVKDFTDQLTSSSCVGLQMFRFCLDFYVLRSQRFSKKGEKGRQATGGSISSSNGGNGPFRCGRNLMI